MPLSSRWLRYGWIATGALSLALIALLILRARTQRDADRSVDHTLEVVGGLRAVQADMEAMSSELRGYLIVGRADWLQAYGNDLRSARQNLARLRELVRDSPIQTARSETLTQNLERGIANGERVRQAYQSRGSAAAAEEFATVSAANGRARSNELIRTMLDQETTLLADRRHRSARIYTLALALESILALVLLVQVSASAMLVRQRYASFRREQEILRSAQAYSEAIVATVREPLIVLDTDLRVVSANRSFHLLFQRTEEQTAGLPFAGLDGGIWNIPDLIARLHAVVDEHAELNSFHVVHSFPGLGQRKLVLNARKVYRPGNSKGLLLVAIEDQTERLLAEERLLRINEELEGFAYSMAHDLRTPLRGMQGFSQVLVEDHGEALGETGRRYAEMIARAARRMDTMIRDLLDYSRLARSELALGPVALADVVAAARAQLAGELESAKAAVEVEGPLPTVAGHFPTLVQMVANLLGNAAKFATPGRPPRVRVWAESKDKITRLWVEDNGIGIAPEHHDRIFQVFERLHGQDAYAGTGIGLAIVRKGAERLGGRAGVDSAAGEGARFWIELPADR